MLKIKRLICFRANSAVFMLQNRLPCNCVLDCRSMSTLFIGAFGYFCRQYVTSVTKESLYLVLVTR